MPGALEQVFFEETRILLLRMDQAITELMSGYHEESLDVLFRSAHTLKSSARALGYHDLGSLVHDIESQCEVARGKREVPTFLSRLHALLGELRVLVEKNVPIEGELTKPLHDLWYSLVPIHSVGSFSIPEHLILSKNEYSKLMSAMETISSERLRVEALGDSMIQTLRRSLPGESEVLPREYEGASTLLRRGITDLEGLLRDARMIPLSVFFDRLPLLVENLSHDLKKEIRLEVSGGNLLIDRAVVGELGGTLLHLVRNAIDHGIEGTGSLKVGGEQVRDHIHLTIEDSGRGIQYEELEHTAKQKGFIDRDKILSQSEREELLFHPHLSTKTEVTEVSGRGVGMDAVRAYVRSVGGSIVILSPVHEQKGTRITLRIPVSLSLVRILIVRIGNGTFGIPLGGTKESLPFQEEDVETRDGKSYLRVRDRSLPLRRLQDILELRSGYTMKKNPMILIGETKEGEICFLVDAIVHEEDVLMKALPNMLSPLRTFAGAATVSDGRTILILDLSGIPENPVTQVSPSSEIHAVGTEDRDILMEVMNIVASHAGTAISRRLGKPVALSVPEFGDMDGGLSQDDWGETAIGVRMSLEGSYPGRLLFEIPASLAGRITEQVLGKSADLHALSGDERIFFQEIAGVAMHAMGNKLSQLSKQPVMTQISDMRVDARGALRSHFLSAHEEVQDRIHVRLWFGIGEGIRTDDHRETGSITMELPRHTAESLILASRTLLAS